MITIYVVCKQKNQLRNCVNRLIGSLKRFLVGYVHDKKRNTITYQQGNTTRMIIFKRESDLVLDGAKNDRLVICYDVKDVDQLYSEISKLMKNTVINVVSKKVI